MHKWKRSFASWPARARWARRDRIPVRCDDRPWPPGADAQGSRRSGADAEGRLTGVRLASRCSSRPRRGERWLMTFPWICQVTWRCSLLVGPRNEHPTRAPESGIRGRVPERRDCGRGADGLESGRGCRVSNDGQAVSTATLRGQDGDRAQRRPGSSRPKRNHSGRIAVTGGTAP